MKKLIILSIFTFLFQSPLMYSTPVDFIPVENEVVETKEITQKKKGNFFTRLQEKMFNRKIKRALKKKNKKKRFFSKFTDFILKRRMGKIAKKLGLGESECAKLVNNDGQEIDVKIVSVDDSGVKYQKCESNDHSIWTTAKDDVFIIKSTVGEDVIYTDIESLATKNKLKKRLAEEDETKGAWALGFLIGFLGGLIGILILALVMEGPRRRKALNGAWIGLLVFLLIYLVIVFATLSLNQV